MLFTGKACKVYFILTLQAFVIVALNVHVLSDNRLFTRLCVNYYLKCCGRNKKIIYFCI